MNEIKRQLYFALLLTGILVAAWFIQDSLFLNWDVSYLLRAAKQLLAGGDYTRDFFTPNPPLILYLYMPPLLLTQLTGLSLIIAVRAYLFLFAGFSFWLCARFARQLFGEDYQATHFVQSAFLLALAVVLFILPFYDFGQREHLLLLLTLPYLFLVARRLQGDTIRTRTAMIVGFMAALGLALKPQFYALPLLIELYYLARKKSLRACLRPETVMIVAVLFAYVVAVLCFYPDFAWFVLPYVLRNFYGSIREPWPRLLFNHLALFCALPLIWSVLLRKMNPYRNLGAILAFGELAFLCAYLAQQTTFYYHLLPAFALALLLQVLLFSLFATRSLYTRQDFLIALLVGLLNFALLFYQARPVWLVPIFAEPAFFAFFGLLFFYLLLAAPQKQSLLRILFSIALSLAIGLLCLSLAARTSGWSSWQLPVAVLVLLALFGLVAPRLRRGVFGNLLLATLGVLLFAYPAFFSYCLYWKGQEYKEQVLNQLIVFMREQAPHRSLYVFSVNGSYGSPLSDYTGSQLTQRFDCLWPLKGFVHRDGFDARSAQDQRLFIDMIAEDLERQKPDLVFVDRRDYKLLSAEQSFSYLAFFSQEPRFRDAWKAYHYMTTLKNDFGYELAVYRRQ